jgi:hypothetical protein
MKKSDLTIITFFSKRRYLLLLLVTVISWLPVLTIPFINDDYQILGFHLNKGIISIFQPFWKSDVSLYYWRPVGNLLHPLLLQIGGLHPLIFRIASLVIYFLCCLTFMTALDKIGFNKINSLVTALLFAILPSHELQIAWIADQGESLLTIFIILAFIYYLEGIRSDLNKNYLKAAFFFFIAVLIKETAFAGVLIPLIVIVLPINKNPKIIRKSILHVCIAILLISMILVYRYFIIGGTPINPVHFGGTNPVKWFINFFIYIPLSFFPPETLEWLLNIAHNKLVLIFIAVLFLLLASLLYKVFIKLDPEKKKNQVAGLLWFIIFVIPAIPNLMRWYAFTASLGLMIFIGVFFEKVFVDSTRFKIFLIIFIVIVCSVSFNNFNLMCRWNKAGERLQFALEDLNEKKDEIKKDTIIIWAVPDKLDRIPMMKLGVKETIQWALNDKRIEVLAPLRAELIDEKTRIKLISHSDSTLILSIDGGKFLQERSESRSIIKDELLEYYYEGSKYRIETRVDVPGKPFSKVIVNFGNREFKKFGQLYFDGEKFVKI